MKKFILVSVVTLALCGFALVCFGGDTNEVVKPPTIELSVEEITTTTVDVADAQAQNKVAKVLKIVDLADGSLVSLYEGIARLNTADKVNKDAVAALTDLTKKATPIYEKASTVYTEGIFRANLATIVKMRATTDVERLEAAIGYFEAAVLFNTAAEMLIEVIEIGKEGTVIYERAIIDPDLET